MQPQKVVIKKYENRRLYDTAASRYVNLDEVARMVREGAEVQVLDAATGEDLTRLTLTQIIMDDAKGRDSTFPVDMLREMIVTSGASSQEALLKYMKTALEMYQNAYRAFTPTAPPLDFMSAWQPRPTAPREAPKPESEVSELRRRVEELEKMVTESAARRSKPRKPKNPR